MHLFDQAVYTTNAMIASTFVASFPEYLLRSFVVFWIASFPEDLLQRFRRLRELIPLDQPLLLNPTLRSDFIVDADVMVGLCGHR